MGPPIIYLDYIKIICYYIHVMKKDIHPNYKTITAQCACGASYVTGSTRDEIKVEICSACHPFFTGKQKLVDTAGRVDKFKAKMETARKIREEKAKNDAAKAEREAKKAAEENNTKKQLVLYQNRPILFYNKYAVDFLKQ